jgi:hypothetical protein
MLFNQRQRCALKPAWGNAPGPNRETEQGLKARALTFTRFHHSGSNEADVSLLARISSPNEQRYDEGDDSPRHLQPNRPDQSK